LIEANISKKPLDRNVKRFELVEWAEVGLFQTAFPMIFEQ